MASDFGLEQPRRRKCLRWTHLHVLAELVSNLEGLTPCPLLSRELRASPRPTRATWPGPCPTSGSPCDGQHAAMRRRGRLARSREAPGEGGVRSDRVSYEGL